MPTFKTSGHWQQTDIETGKVMSGETFTCCHCGKLVDVVFGSDMAICDYEKLPLCRGCSIRFHSGCVCPATQARLSFLERCQKEQAGRDALLKSVCG
jgi:hypothetical protein